MNINLNKNMTKKLITTKNSVMVEEALMIMKNHQIRHLPVENEKNEIVGFVSERDLLRNLNPNDVQIGEIMVTNIHKFDISTPIRQIVDAMIKEKLSAFLVTHDQKIAGIITSDDMLHVLSQLLDEAEHSKSLLADFVDGAKEISGAVKNPNLIT